MSESSDIIGPAVGIGFDVTTAAVIAAISGPMVRAQICVTWNSNVARR
jgi:citrate lyase alpha subunit